MTTALKSQLLSLPLGEIKGCKRQTIYEDDYYSFEGIPYAQPPLGELRFKAPMPVEPWNGIRDCTECANKPMQTSHLTLQIEGDEDCLYLNVYTKTLSSAKPLPVLVWIYGGAFTMGEATRHLYSPDYFMAKDVVLVTLNYRVCSLGFLSLKDPSLEIPGNAGLKDQVLALKWVKQYISHFNGDSDNITIFGESAGGVSTHYMMTTEQTRGLFHKAIPMSGCVLNHWAISEARDSAYRLAVLHGYQGENVDRQVLAHLRTLPANKLVEHNFLTSEDQRNGSIYTFGPTVESYVGADCVIPEPPLEMLRKAWGNQIPMMIGGTSFEGLFMYPTLKANLDGLRDFANDPTLFVPYDVKVQQTDAENKALGELMIRMYFGEKQPGSDHVINFLDYYSYKIFWHGLYRTFCSRLKYATSVPTYCYRFDFDSLFFNIFRNFFCGDDIKKGVAHADDICYLFFNSFASKLDKNTPEYKTIERMVDIWTAFAANTDPNCPKLGSLKWTPLTATDPDKVFNISHELSIIDLPEREKLSVWQSLYKPDQLF